MLQISTRYKVCREPAGGKEFEGKKAGVGKGETVRNPLMNLFVLEGLFLWFTINQRMKC
jgi:hypothetical protein